MMSKLYIFLIVYCVGVNVRSQTVPNVRLVDHISYFTKLMQESMNEIERRGWHNLKLTDSTNVLDSAIYGWELHGNVSYKNGFVVSIQSMHLVTPTTQMWSPGNAALNRTDSVNVYDTLSLNEVSVGYDVQVDLNNGSTHHFTGIYTHENVRFRANIEKNLHSNEYTTSASVALLSGGITRRILFLPSDSISEVVQRNFQPSSTMGSAVIWGEQIADIMQEKATVIPFPEICYNCAA